MDNKIVVIRKDELSDNISILKNKIETKIIAVLKGDGYGLGILEMTCFVQVSAERRGIYTRQV